MISRKWGEDFLKAPTESALPVIRFADVEVCEENFLITRQGSRLALEPKAFRLLLYLLHRPGHVVRKEELLDAVWADTAVTEDSLIRLVGLLRRALGDDPREPRFIETVATVGYRFVCPITTVEDEGAAVAPLEQPQTGQGLHSGVRRRWITAAVGATATTLALLSFAWSWFSSTPRLRVTGITQLTHDPLPMLFAGTDGTRLIVNRFAPPETKILQVPVSGGQLAPFAHSVLVPWVQDVASDGTLLMTSATWGQGVWMVDAAGNKLSRVLQPVNFTGVAIAPNRETVAYANFDGEIRLVGKDGLEIRKLTSATDLVSRRLVTDLAWSPNGEVLRYTRAHKIWEVSAHGSTPRRVFPDLPDTWRECCGHWSRDGSYFVFVIHDSVERFTSTGAQIWAVDERRSAWRQSVRKPYQLTSPGPIRWTLPLTSNDGSKIYAQGVTPRGELQRFDRSANEFKPFLRGISAEYLDFSNDGKWVAYVTFPDGNLWKAHRDGSNAQQLTWPPLYPLLPKWSPDGKDILFTNAPDDLTPACAAWMTMTDEAYLISSEGGRPRRLQPGNKMMIMYPDWSPDGRKIVFATCAKCEAADPADRYIAILDVTSNSVARLPGSERMYFALWSPEGQRIFTRPIAETEKSKLYDLKSGRWSEVDMGLAPSFPAWSHDGRYIYYAGSYFDAAVKRVLVPGGRPEFVASIRDNPFTGWFGLWLGFDPDDAPLWLRDTSTDELYALSTERR